MFPVGLKCRLVRYAWQAQTVIFLYFRVCFAGSVYLGAVWQMARSLEVGSCVSGLRRHELANMERIRSLRAGSQGLCL